MPTKMPTKDEILAILSSIIDTKTVSGVLIREGKIGWSIDIPKEQVAEFEPTRIRCFETLSALEAVEDVNIVLTALHIPTPKALSKVKKIIAIASGKGGVGKSSMTLQCALALRDRGYRVGIVDADVFGPSMPYLLNSENAKPEADIYHRLSPVMAYGMATMSMGYLVDKEKSTVWRGPMVTKAIHQLFEGVTWPECDVLLVDLPPGTGDVQLSLVKNHPIDGALLVTTPQALSVLDVRKAADMFKKLETPILGMIENMSYMMVGQARHHLFGDGGAKELEAELSIPLLGQVPVDQAIQAGLEDKDPLSSEDVASNPLCSLPDDLAQKLVNVILSK